MVVEGMEPEGRVEGPMEDPLPPNLRLPRVLCNRLRFSFSFSFGGGGGGGCPCDLDVDAWIRILLYWYWYHVVCVIETFKLYTAVVMMLPVPTWSGLAGNTRDCAFLIVPMGLSADRFARQMHRGMCSLSCPASNLWI